MPDQVGHDRQIPTRRRIRFFFELEPGDLRALFWAELANDTGDFYWGPPTDGPAIESQPFNGTTAEIAIPEDLDAYGRHNWKASHHASGVMHVTDSVSGPNDRYWGRPDALTAPNRFCVILSKAPAMLPPYRRSPTRGNSAAVIMRIPKEHWHVRHYLELFLSPAGEFDVPEPALAFTTAVADQPITQSLSTERDLLLLVRRLVLSGSVSTWRPETQLWMMMDPLGDSAE